MKRTIEFKTTAWLRETSDPRCLSSNDASLLSQNLSFHCAHDMSSHWTRVGDATVSVEVEITNDNAIQQTVGRLRNEASKIRAEGERRANYIEQQISNLLALSHNAVEVMP